MSKRVKIGKLTLEIDGKVIDLTIDQAMELRDLLNDTFGGDPTVVVPPVVIREHPWGWPYTITSHWTASYNGNSGTDVLALALKASS